MSKSWCVEMVVTRTFSVLYYVEAETREEAADLAEQGETEKEFEVKTLDVVGRTIVGGPEEENA